MAWRSHAPTPTALHIRWGLSVQVQFRSGPTSGSEGVRLSQSPSSLTWTPGVSLSCSKPGRAHPGLS